MNLLRFTNTLLALLLITPAWLMAKGYYPNNASHAISLSFDDAKSSQVDIGLPILDKHNIKASFYLIPEKMMARKDKWSLAARNGHEIANHTESHLCTGNFRWLREKGKGLEQVDLAFIKNDISTAQKKIYNLTNKQAVGFAYPCGEKFVGRGEQVKSYVPIVANMFEYGRTWNDETANDPNYYDPAQVRAFPMDGKTFEEIKALLNRVKFENAWIVLAGHEVGSKDLYSVDKVMLEQLIVYLKDPKNGFWLGTVAEVNRFIQAKKRTNTPSGKK